MARVISAKAIRLLAVSSLIGMAILWGSTFFSIKALVSRVPVPDMLAQRFTIAAIVLGILGWRHWVMSLRTLYQGVILGLLFGTAQLFQTFGIDATSASVSGFITGLYVVFTPLLAALLLKQRAGFITTLAVALATVGMGILSLNIAEGIRLGSGEILVIVSAILYAGHIIAASKYSTNDNAISLALVQTVIVAAVCWPMACLDGVNWPGSVGDWMWLLYLAILCGSLTIFLQIWAQAHIESTRAAVIMATEPLWAALFAILFGGEILTLRMATGGLIIFIGMVIVITAPNLDNFIKNRS